MAAPSNSALAHPGATPSRVESLMVTKPPRPRAHRIEPITLSYSHPGVWRWVATCSGPDGPPHHTHTSVPSVSAATDQVSARRFRCRTITGNRASGHTLARMAAANATPPSRSRRRTTSASALTASATEMRSMVVRRKPISGTVRSR